MSKENIDRWIKATVNKVIIAGYGSLLSRCSRERYSRIFFPSLAFDIRGWQRGWVTRSLPERQTYVGAVRDNQGLITTQLIPTEIDPSLKVREQDYRFVRIHPDTLVMPDVLRGHDGLKETLHKVPIYICESLDIIHADADFPVNFSYIATCLAGAQESDPVMGVDKFLKNTKYWDTAAIHMDIERAAYPRAAKVSERQQQAFISALHNHLLLHDLK